MGLLSKAISIQVVTGRTNGLLRRLTMLSRELESGAAPAASHRGNGGGLLKRSLLLLSLEKEEAPGAESLLIVDFSENIDRLLRRIGDLSRDFSYFPGLYSLLLKELRLPQSAFFLSSAQPDEFVPWMHRGLDARLASALSFTERRWREHSRPPAGEPFLLRDERRLFPGLPRPLPKPLFLFPFTDQGAVEGGLLVGNFPVHPSSRPSLFALFRSLSAKIGPAVGQLMKGVKALDRPAQASAESALASVLEGGKGGGSACRVLALPLAPFFKALYEKYGFFDQRRMREIIIAVVNSSLQGLGMGAALGEADLVIAARGTDFFSPQLLAAHVSHHLKDFFKGLFDQAPPLAPSRTIDYPACGLKPLEILAELQS